MLGDINISEPGALIGFAGPRVIKETIKKDLPKGFQTSEFVLEHGFLDFIVDSRQMKEKLGSFLKMLNSYNSIVSLRFLLLHCSPKAGKMQRSPVVFSLKDMP
jgi:acetyl-CoA carboxylase beta subunit